MVPVILEAAFVDVNVFEVYAARRLILKVQRTRVVAEFNSSQVAGGFQPFDDQFCKCPVLMMAL